jgi:hypothetical protein
MSITEKRETMEMFAQMPEAVQMAFAAGRAYGAMEATVKGGGVDAGLDQTEDGRQEAGEGAAGWCTHD